MSELIHVKGLKELDAFLAQLPERLQRNVMRGALGAGAKRIRDAARLLCPVGEPSAEGRRLYGHYRGALRDSIRVGTTVKNNRVMAVVKAGGKSKGADIWYAHIIEFTGAVPHLVNAKKGGSLFLGSVFAKHVRHPGMKAKPFLRPALNRNAENAVREVAEYMRKRLSTKEGLTGAGSVRIGG